MSGSWLGPTPSRIAVSHPGTSLRVAPALQRAFGLPGCAEPAVLADTLNAATDRDGAAVRAAVEAIFHRHSPARPHACTHDMLIRDRDLSPLPTRA